ncbi:hypothetical protein SAMN05192589_12166 [Paracidovorax valerianellae]|uniref:Uncharacterized protein n=1 Tax=Paracidovorax valerianellae TaxID=187868 RepID=A0A1G7E3Z5_9BURK|nr:hypothetical protein SAMN05192589_12166 [Paracidovorax valerianellae]
MLKSDLQRDKIIIIHRISQIIYAINNKIPREYLIIATHNRVNDLLSICRSQRRITKQINCHIIF